MRTYQLSSGSKQAIHRLSAQNTVKRSTSKGSRCVALTTKALTDEQLTGLTVHEDFKGDCYDSVAAWTLTNVVEEIEALHVSQRRPAESVRNKSINRWYELNSDVLSAATALAKARAKAESASRHLLLTLGRSVSIDGDIYDASRKGEKVFFLKRRGG